LPCHWLRDLQAVRCAAESGRYLPAIQLLMACATMCILDDRFLIALKLPADYRIARLGSVRFPSHSAVRIAGT